MSFVSRSWKAKKKESRISKWYKLDFLRWIIKDNPKIDKKLISSIFQVSRWSLYYKKNILIRDEILKTKIKLIHIFDPYYWQRRLAYTIKRNKKVITRVVQKYSLYAISRKRKFRKPWDMNLSNMAVENIKKTLEINTINKVWSTDFTHLYYKEKQFYLATVIDEYTKKIVWYSLWFYHTKELILSSINNAIWNSNKKPIILHSDQWSEYRSYEYLDLLRKNDIQVSMSRKSSPWENSVQESFYWKFKFELWNLNRFSSIDEVIEYIHLKIHYYNNNRIHTTLKMTPRQFEQKLLNLVNFV